MRTILYLFFFCPILLMGQHLEAGLQVGASNYLGDLSANSSTIFFNESKFVGGVFARYNVHDFVAVRLGVQAASLSGKDANSTDAAIQERNLSFTTGLFEASLTAEFNILGYQPYNLQRPFSPYVYAGLGFFYFNPRAEYEGELVNLRDIGTEGQGIAGRPATYNAVQLSIPFGIGIKYALNDSWNLGLSLGPRITFTDYLDDVSGTYVSRPELLAANGELAAALGNRTGELTGGEPVIVPTGTQRGDNQDTDWYFILGLSISYNFMDNGLVGSRGRTRGGKKGCRTN